MRFLKSYLKSIFKSCLRRSQQPKLDAYYLKLLGIVNKGNGLDSSSGNHHWNVKTNWEDTAGFLQRLFRRCLDISNQWLLALYIYSFSGGGTNYRQSVDS